MYPYFHYQLTVSETGEGVDFQKQTLHVTYSVQGAERDENEWISSVCMHVEKLAVFPLEESMPAKMLGFSN